MNKAKEPELEAFYKTRPEVMENTVAMDEATERRARYDAKFNTQLPFAATAMRDVPNARPTASSASAATSSRRAKSSRAVSRRCSPIHHRPR